MSRWFRHYAGLCRDEKLVRAAMKSGQPVERVVWVWAAILESAAEIDDAGRFELDSAEVAYFLRSDEADIDSVVSALEAGGRVSGDHVVNWGARQFQSDSSAERQRRHRDRQKAQGDAQRIGGDKDVERHTDDGVTSGDGDVTAEDRHRDGHVTSPSRRGDAPETETETETETEKKDTSSLRSEGVADAPPDERTRLFREAVPAVSRITGKPSASARSLVARWLKLTGDDCIAVRRLIEDAERERPVEPVSWIESRLRPIQSTGPPRRSGNGFAAAGLELMEQERERRRNQYETINLNAEDRFP